MYAGQDLLGVHIPVLSVMSATLACVGAIVSLTLGFLILGEDFGDVVPARWIVVFAGSTVAAFVLLLAAIVSGRQWRLRGWREGADAWFFWETCLSIAAALVFGVATAVDDGFPGYLCLASILAAYITLARWTWWTWRAVRY